ncbi:unnamed protein product [Protopolystoma xenopodis]|uniref:Uncharacterized protein n=1 Tax=Protopolystoma xenopodis TaxID=117903 RepID=A0A3S5ATF1_9PLAT|nr:unnamed protein product [Protopolystoma xenopodis]
MSQLYFVKCCTTPCSLARTTQNKACPSGSLSISLTLSLYRASPCVLSHALRDLEVSLVLLSSPPPNQFFRLPSLWQPHFLCPSLSLSLLLFLTFSVSAGLHG